MHNSCVSCVIIDLLFGQRDPDLRVMRSGTRISCLSLVQLLLALLEGYCMEVVSSSSRLPDIYWNASNPM